MKYGYVNFIFSQIFISLTLFKTNIYSSTSTVCSSIYILHYVMATWHNLNHWCSCPPITFSNMASVDSPHQGLFCFFSLVHSWMHKKRINICLGYDIYFNIVQAHFPMRPGKFMNRFWNLDLWECYRELMISREMLAGPWKYDTFGEC